MYSEKEILCLLRVNKERVGVYFDKKSNGFKLKARPDVKLKKSKYIDTYQISDTERKYLDILRLNPNLILLEYSEMEYYILISTIPRREIKLLEGMKYSAEKGYYDENTTLNVVN